MAQKINGIDVAGQYISLGDVSADDLIQSGMTLDSTWVDWDLGPGGTGKVPAGAVAIELAVRAMVNTTVGKSLEFRKNGASDVYNVLYTKTLIANVNQPWGGMVECDTNGVVEYFATGTAGPWTTIQIAVRGYYL